MKRFENQRILLAVTGGIAAYKACDFIRALYREGATQVTCLMTPSAQSFITPLTLESLSKQPVYLQNLENTLDGIPTHIALAQTMDVLVILPASANTMAKLAHGMADNLVTTTALTFTDKPIVIAPAMNTRMWENPLTQQNLKTLETLGNMTMIPPSAGELACGEIGEGKLADLETILLHLYQATHPDRNVFLGKRVIVTAGGTAEPIDLVRTLSNRSSGKMGLALADELFAMGAEVLLLHSIEGIEKPYQTVFLTTAQAFSIEVAHHFQHADGLIMAAAIADFELDPRAQEQLKTKVKKQDGLQLDLVKTPDILMQISRMKQPHQFVVGFAAEAEDIIAHATEKLTQKQLDMIVVNDISRQDIGFASDENEVTLLLQGHAPIPMAKAPKFKIAREILKELAQRLASLKGVQPNVITHTTEERTA